MCIEAQELSKLYKKNRGLLSASVAIDRGEMVAIVGPNGAGKSTLIKLLGNWIVPSGGSATVEGFPVSERLSIVRKIGFVPEAANLFEYFSAEYNLKLFARLFKLPLARVDEICHEFNLQPFRKQKIVTLSKGQKQRVSLGRALMANPAILLLDEPTSGLDIEMTRAIQSSLTSLNQMGKTIVFTSHRSEEIKGLAKRVISISGGRIVFDGTSHEYFKSQVQHEISA